MPKARTLTEKRESSRRTRSPGAGVAAGQQVIVISPKEGVWARGQIVYCQLLADCRFAVGLELSVGWSRGQSLTSAAPTILAKR